MFLGRRGGDGGGDRMSDIGKNAIRVQRVISIGVARQSGREQRGNQDESPRP